MKSSLFFAAWLAVSLSAARAGETVFVTPPRAELAGDKVRISFAVAAPTDVEISVLDARGAVVRHLVAGMLGAKPPSPLRPGLAQELE